ncbi:MAG: hypothetical protein HYX94_09075 [Chloroflexi bacterium]|nr:hypothetical protein [Chloroflexota bacterium]
MNDMGQGWRLPAAEGDEVCHGYRDCLTLIAQGQFDKAAEVIADLWPVDPRYAKSLADRLEVARRWQRAQKDDGERQRFWEWLDSRR